MKTLSIDQLKAAAQDVFAANKGVETLFATSDGQFFLPHAKNSAINHSNKTGLKLQEIEKETVLAKKTAEQRIEAINECATVEEVEFLLEIEKAKTVLAAGAAKIEELSSGEDSK